MIFVFVKGNMWAQTWSSIYDLVVPFSNVSLNDISTVLKEHVRGHFHFLNGDDNLSFDLYIERVKF